jgi:citrate synthase
MTFMAKTVVHQDLKSYFGDEDHLGKSQRTSFAGMVFEALSERVPSEAELKVFELVLNLSIDHGPDTPSAIPLIESAKAGKSLSEALSDGLLQINESHGGAVAGSMKNLYKISNEQLTINNLVKQELEAGRRMPGFGHRIYKEGDPRTELIFNMLKENGLGEEFKEIEVSLKQEILNQTGKDLPINIDGAIAVVLCTFGWDPKLGNAVFVIARVPGLCAHYLNNSASE